uniref:Uncharacterized protein n=1 Tax=Vespula pensylvanica TaxID=30213 RepID=A0A834JQJ6_VESPE|nr:hypothetical protein H0235_017481 [Vespula pensylvanica]
MMDPLLHDTSVGHNTMEDGKTCSTQDRPLFDNHGIRYTTAYAIGKIRLEHHPMDHPIQSSLPSNPLVFCYTEDIILLALRETIEAAIPITKEEDDARPIGVKALGLWTAIEKTQAIIIQDETSIQQEVKPNRSKTHQCGIKLNKVGGLGSNSVVIPPERSPEFRSKKHV